MAERGYAPDCEPGPGTDEAGVCPLHFLAGDFCQSRLVHAVSTRDKDEEGLP